MKFNWLDIVFMALAVRGLYVGARRGILGELALTAGILASIILGTLMSTPVGSIISSRLSLGLDLSNRVATWTLVILGILISFLLGKIVQKLSHLFFQSSIDRMIGGLLGAVRAILLTAILMTALVKLPSEFFQIHTQESIIGSYLAGKVDEFYGLLKQKITPAQLIEIGEELSDTGEEAPTDGEARNP